MIAPVLFLFILLSLPSVLVRGASWRKSVSELNEKKFSPL